MLQQLTLSSQTSLQPSQTEKSQISDSRSKNHNSYLQPIDASTSTNKDPERNSQHLDNLLCSSFVQIDRFVQKQDLTFNLESGDSFFKKSNNIFFSEFTKVQSQKMNHKKVQCEIGQGLCLANNEVEVNLLNKLKTLQVLKMAKLIRIIFKQLRSSIFAIKQEVNLHTREIQREFFQMNSFFVDKVCILGKSLQQKEAKIEQLQRQVQFLREQSFRITQELASQRQLNSRLLQHIEDQNEKHNSLMNKLQYQREEKVMELTQKIDTSQMNQIILNQEVSHLNDIIIEQQRQFRKLQYQKKVLQSQFSELLKRNQELTKKQEENEFSFNEQCTNLYKNSQEILQLKRLNEFYLKEIQSSRQQIQKLKDQNKDIKKQSQAYVANQLQNLNDYFQEKYVLLQSQHKKQVAEKQNFSIKGQIAEKSREERKNSELLRENTNKSFKRGVQFQKQYNNVGQKRTKKHSDQQSKGKSIIQSKDKCPTKIISDSYEGSQNLIFNAKQHFKGKIKLANFILLDTQPSKLQTTTSCESSKNEDHVEKNNSRKSANVFKKT